MRGEFVKCDECGQTHVIDKSKGYPYDMGWKYLYNLEYKLQAKIDFKTMIKDRHFCCMEHFTAYILRQLNQTEVNKCQS